MSTQDYIESYPTQNLSHVSVGSNIIRQDIWQNAARTAFQPNTEFNLADARIRHQSCEYLGFYHTAREVNPIAPTNELACDFFHEPAFKSTEQALSRVFK